LPGGDLVADKVPAVLKFTVMRPAGCKEPVPLTTEVTVPRSAAAERMTAAAGCAKTVSRAIRATSSTATRPRPISPARVPVSQPARRGIAKGFRVG